MNHLHKVRGQISNAIETSPAHGTIEKGWFTLNALPLRKFPKVSQFGEGKTRIVLISLVNEHLPSLSITYARESRDEIPLRGEGCNTPVLVLTLISCLITNQG